MNERQHVIVRARWVILAMTAILCAWLIPGLGSVRHDDDVLKFLPPEDPDVVAFNEVANRFGMLEVALVGLLPPDDGDLLDKARVEQVRDLSIGVSELPGVRLVLSFPELPEASVSGQTLVVKPLVPRELDDPAEIRARVLGNRDAVGNMISSDGRAAALLVYLLPQTGDDRTERRAEVLAGIRAKVAEGWDGPTRFGGAPFVETTAASVSREDIERLSPIVIIVLAVVSALLLGSVTAAVLNLAIAGLAVGLVMGAHGRFDEPLTIVSSTIPVMMVALGGAFGMHILAGYQRQSGTPPQRASAALRELWLPVVLSGLTTAVAFFALVVMPQQPMQRFAVVAGRGVLLLLGLALLVLPALLAVLPGGLIKTRAERTLPFRFVPPAWALLVLAVLGAGGGARLAADPDTNNLFAPESEPRQAAAFFDEHFGGSQFIQVAVEGDLKQPVALREIRDLGEELSRLDGVSEVRSLVDTVALLSEGFGGRAGVPATEAQGRRILVNLVDHPAMAPLLTPGGALIHVKLAPQPGDDQVALTTSIREIVGQHERATLSVGAMSDEAVATHARGQVRSRVQRLVGHAIDEQTFAAAAGGDGSAAVAEVQKLRDRALLTDELVEPQPKAEVDAVDPAEIAKLRGEALETYLREKLPSLHSSDPEGIHYAAKFLGNWLDEATAGQQVEQSCTALQLDPGSPQCAAVKTAVAELQDEHWLVPASGEIPSTHTIDWSLRVTGQPVIGQAFAQSVTESLRTSTLVSLLALAVMLAIVRQLPALVPALWTLAITAGVISVLGHPISIGTSMVSCIALGAGVDFAIHLGFRARKAGGSGQRATEEIGAVVLIAGLQLALAFLVLTASSMPPLRQFGVGLAIGLWGAALGAVWLTPRLWRGPK